MNIKSYTGIFPQNEGKDHINAYSGSKTELGKLLSNFTYFKFSIELDNKQHEFNSIEAFWFWRMSPDDPRRDQIKLLWGHKARNFGLTLKLKPIDNDFKQDILKAIRIKANHYKDKFTNLPIVHYYVYSNRIIIPKDIDDHQFIWDEYNNWIKQ